jgi:hypothetical protein
VFGIVFIGCSPGVFTLCSPGVLTGLAARTGDTPERIADTPLAGFASGFGGLAVLNSRTWLALGVWARQVHWQPPAMNIAYHRTLEILYRKQWAPLRHWLARRFPGAGAAQVEDAVSDAFHDAVARPRPFANALAQGGTDAVMPLLRQVAWRRLRGHLRKKSTRCEVMTGTTREPVHPCTPQTLVLGRELTVHVLALVDQAAAVHGGRRKRALRAALLTRLAGSTDTEAARAHRVRREYVNRAMHWIRRHLAAS